MYSDRSKLWNFKRITLYLILTLIASLIACLCFSVLKQSTKPEWDYFSGKKILILGDSISDTEAYPECWVKSFTEALSHTAKSVDNCSHAGRTISLIDNNDDHNSLIYALENLESDLDYDDIILFMGVNDYYNQVSFGEFYSNDPHCFNGAVNYFHDFFKEKCPEAKIHIITPLKSARTDIISIANPSNLPMYVDNLCTKASYYGWQIIDAHAYAPQINPYVDTELYYDETHPVPEYGRKLSEYILENISNGQSSHDQIATQMNLNLDGTIWAYIDSSGKCTISFSNYEIEGTGMVKLMDIPTSLNPETQIYGSIYTTDSNEGVREYSVVVINGAVYALLGNDHIDESICGSLEPYTFLHNSTHLLVSI